MRAVLNAFSRLGGLVALAVLANISASRADVPEYKLVIEQHRFVPAQLSIPAGMKVRLRIENRDAAAEEFESYDLNREKIVPPKSSIVVFVGPLKRGKYEFFGEFNPQTARGYLVVE